MVQSPFTASQVSGEEWLDSSQLRIRVASQRITCRTRRSLNRLRKKTEAFNALDGDGTSIFIYVRFSAHRHFTAFGVECRNALAYVHGRAFSTHDVHSSGVAWCMDARALVQHGELHALRKIVGRHLVPLWKACTTNSSIR